MFSAVTALYMIHARKCPFKNAALVSVAGYMEKSKWVGVRFRKVNAIPRLGYSRNLLWQSLIPYKRHFLCGLN